MLQSNQVQSIFVGSLVTKFTNILVDESPEPNYTKARNDINNGGCSKMPDEPSVNNARLVLLGKFTQDILNVMHY